MPSKRTGAPGDPSSMFCSYYFVPGLISCCQWCRHFSSQIAVGLCQFKIEARFSSKKSTVYWTLRMALLRLLLTEKLSRGIFWTMNLLQAVWSFATMYVWLYKYIHCLALTYCTAPTLEWKAVCRQTLPIKHYRRRIWGQVGGGLNQWQRTRRRRIPEWPHAVWDYCCCARLLVFNTFFQVGKETRGDSRHQWVVWFCAPFSFWIWVDIAFVSAYLAQEQPTTGGKWSVASGLNETQFEGLNWLVEPKRPSTLIKYSGTLNYPSDRTDLRALTIYAFIHFVYGFSQNNIVFADVQGQSPILTPSSIPMSYSETA